MKWITISSIAISVGSAIGYVIGSLIIK